METLETPKKKILKNEMNDSNFYIAVSLFVIIFVIAAFLMIMIYKLIAKVSLEEKNKQ